MAISGYSLTVVPTALLTITADVQSCTIGGVSLDFSEVKQPNDTNRIPTNLPMTVRESPIELVMTYVKANYAKLRTALKGQTSDTWTVTDSAGSTHAGLGVVASVSGLTLGTDGPATYTATIQPTTTWVFTAN
ncbi:MAG TPA: hypothetical protein VMW52_12260 [Phycisphaerae bacterium]|nr:hypothetical protein [Phycisphaerae bacterium]